MVIIWAVRIVHPIPIHVVRYVQGEDGCHDGPSCHDKSGIICKITRFINYFTMIALEVRLLSLQGKTSCTRAAWSTGDTGISSEVRCTPDQPAHLVFSNTRETTVIILLLCHPCLIQLPAKGLVLTATSFYLTVPISFSIFLTDLVTTPWWQWYPKSARECFISIKINWVITDWKERTVQKTPSVFCLQELPLNLFNWIGPYV